MEHSHKGKLMKTKENVWRNVCWSGQTDPAFHTKTKNKICFDRDPRGGGGGDLGTPIVA